MSARRKIARAAAKRTAWIDRIARAMAEGKALARLRAEDEKEHAAAMKR